MKPYSTPGANRYCRLLPPSAEAVNTPAYFQALYELGGAMLDDGSPLSRAPESPVTTGYTYFGQFIDHDITRDDSSIDDALTMVPEEIKNHQTPRLDLGHLYGKGPFDPTDAKFYEPNDVRFKHGPRTGRGGGSFDVGPDGKGTRLVADDRTVENVILRQVAAVFVNLHNCAVEQFRKDIRQSAELFARARRQTVWQFQWLVYEDFLLWLLDDVVYETVFRRRQPMFEWNVLSTPVEFSVAAMRFGHSLVREKYFLSEDNEKNLAQLFAGGLRQETLPPDYEVDWSFFFQGAGSGGSSLFVRPIDTRISRSLHHLPEETKRLFNAASVDAHALLPPDALSKLPVRTLVRGAGLRLGSGQVAAKIFCESVLSEEELTTDREGQLTDAGTILRDRKMSAETPLWYYILKESEVRYNGNRIGPVGSRIIAETLYGALLHDPESILNHPEAEASKPPKWTIAGQDYEFVDLISLFAAAPQLAKA
jgi:hypothetical protein